jgi:hypothetical protein
MGLFGKTRPTVQPVVERPDVAAAIKSAPIRELERLAWAQPELDYLSESLPIEENIVGIASCSATTAGITFGVIALTPNRLVAVIGQRSKGGPSGKVIGEPSVLVLDFRRLSNLTFGSKHVRGVAGYFATFSHEGQGDLVLDIGQDDNWADAFLNQARHQMNRAKLA